MKSILLFTIINLLYISSIFSQSTIIKNVNLYYKDQKAIINYDLKEFNSENTLHKIELFFADESFNIRVPEKIFGDYGDSISAGNNKQIQWALFDDNINITNKLQPIILIDGLNKRGSNNVLFSILVPGLGDYFVENPRNMIFKPYLRTLTALGAITLGYIADQKRVKLVWKEWLTVGNHEEKNGIIYKDDYWLFAFDKELFYFVGISIWVMDIIWVYAKGNQNERLKAFTKYNLSFNKTNGFSNLSINIKL